MTEISKAFRVTLPEDQGTVCLTEQGLRSLRAKIDKEIGVSLPLGRPTGVDLDRWNDYQAAMRAQITAREKAESENARLRGSTDAETAQNIVRDLNTWAQAAKAAKGFTIKEGTFAPTQPNRDVRKWYRVDDGQPNIYMGILSYDRETDRFRFESAIRPGSHGRWHTWAVVVESPAAWGTWFPVNRYPA